MMKFQHRTHTFVVFIVGASICKPFAEPTFEQATYVKKSIPILTQCPVVSKIELEHY
jgi:hypothetical protein